LSPPFAFEFKTVGGANQRVGANCPLPLALSVKQPYSEFAKGWLQIVHTLSHIG